MPTINVDMMKQLLQEFDEKEALTAEEIKVIEEQITELETRITTCRDRLQNLNEDKDRLAAMMSRYTGKGPLKVAGGKPKPTGRLADSTQPKLDAVTTVETIASEPAKSGLIEDLEAGPQGESSENDVGQGAAAGGDDAIKSINDALKGLFRK